MNGAMMLALLHGRNVVTPLDVWSTWTFEPVVLIPLLVAAALYARGVDAVWRRAGTGRGIKRAQAAAFGAGMAVMLIAQVTPLAAMGAALFSAHMTQHVLIMGVAAPLLVLGAPGVAFAWAVPQGALRQLRSSVLHQPAFRAVVAALSIPVVAWLLHASAIWIWHVPALYSRSIESSLAHALQHGSFFATAMLFWWVLRRRALHAIGVIYLFITAVHSSLLGAVLVFEGAPLYAPYLESAGLWGMSALHDQQLGGLIMWVPAGLIYLAAALALVASLLRDSRARPAVMREPGTRARAVGNGIAPAPAAAAPECII